MVDAVIRFQIYVHIDDRDRSTRLFETSNSFLAMRIADLRAELFPKDRVFVLRDHEVVLELKPSFKKVQNHVRRSQTQRSR